MNMETKIKYMGQTLRVRTMESTEIIGSKSLQTLGVCTTAEQIKAGDWMRSYSEGELVGDHPERTYIEILSKYFWFY
jgi:hypothetical protein